MSVIDVQGLVSGKLLLDLGLLSRHGSTQDHRRGGSFQVSLI